MSQTIVELKDIAPRRNDRVALFGQTGTGKTTLARALLQEREHVVVLDTKRRIAWPGYTVFTDFRKLCNIDPEKTERVIFKPSYSDTVDNDGAIMNAFFRWVFERRRCTLYVDELADVTTGDRFPFHYGACLREGRELGIEVVSGTQRPTNIPQIAMSEAEHIYCFKLRMYADRQRVERLTAIPSDQIAALYKRQFLYAPQDGEIVGPLTLDLNQRAVA
jgi:hypothetical protein